MAIFKSFEEVSPFLEEICDLADRNRLVFGFLPRSAYVGLAAKDQCWVARTSDGELSGYLLFGRSKSRIRIFQLLVCDASRSTGIGTRLIREIKSFTQQLGYQTISARVAADLPANSFWEKEGFRLIRQVPGGQSSNRLINERLYEVVGCSLWEPSSRDIHAASAVVSALPIQQPILSAPNFALDLNVLFDVLKDREHATLMTEVLGFAFGGECRLCVTSEFVSELQRTSMSIEHDPVLKLAKSLPTLPSVPAKLLSDLVVDLRKLIFPEAGRSVKRRANDESDLMHLALCIHHKISGYVTREGAILRKSEKLKEKFGLEALSPADLLADISPSSANAPAILGEVRGQRFSVSSLQEHDRYKVVSFLRSQNLSDHRIGVVLEPGTVEAPRTRLVFALDSTIGGFASWDPIAGQRPEALLYVIVDEGIKACQQAVDHALEGITQTLPSGRMTKISLLTGSAQAESRETALKRGYALSAGPTAIDGLLTSTRYAYRGIVTEKNWNTFAQALEGITGTTVTRRCPSHSELTNTGLVLERLGRNEKICVPLFELETSLAPVLIIGKGRSGVITPIKEVFANDLIASSTKQYTLFVKEAPIHLERSYFGKPGMERHFLRGSIVVFYISGQRKEAVGFARVTAAGRYSIEDAAATFARQGVLETNELMHMSTDGHVGVFTFDSYRNFNSPIAFAELRRRDIATASNLVTSQRISYEQIIELMNLGKQK